MRRYIFDKKYEKFAFTNFVTTGTILLDAKRKLQMTVPETDPDFGL